MVATRFGHLQRRSSTSAGVALAAVMHATTPATAQTVTVQATSNNMYTANVTLNNQLTARALIDTGATYLSLCGAAAKRLGLKLGESVQMRTANGIITSRLTMVKSVRIGPIEVRNVPAVVDDDDARCHDKILVGMTVLKHLHVTLDGNTMTLVARRGMQAGSSSWWSPWSLMLAGLWAVLVLSLIGMRGRRSGLLLRTGRLRSSRIARNFY